MSEEPATQRATASPVQRTTKRVVDVLATVIGAGTILAAVLVVLDDGPVGSGLMLLIAGLVLMPFIRVPGRGTRTLVFIVCLGVALVTPIWKSMVVHRQTQAALLFATAAAEKLTQMVAKDGQWPTTAAAFPDKLEPAYAGGYSNDLELWDCGGEQCTLIVTLADHDYDTSIRSRHFALYTTDGGKTWTCRPASPYAVIPADLPLVCRN